MKIAVAIVIFLLQPLRLVAASCDEEVSELAWLESANPEVDAINALNEGNIKFIAVYGFTLIIPGLNLEEYSEALHLQNYSPIEGTTDGFCSEEHYLLNQIAVNYAAVYNQTIKENL